VNDELSKYRSADGKQPFLDIDEEQRLCNMLQVMSDGFEQSI
jgi:hypothetical protein